MSKRAEISRVFKLAKEVHNESNDYEGYNPNEDVLYTVIFGTEKQAEFLIKELERLNCECHSENERGEKRTMWSVITPYEI